MTQDNISISVKDFITLKKYFLKLNDENSQLQREIISVKEGLNRISGAIIELEKFITEVDDELGKMNKRISKVNKYFERKEELSIRSVEAYLEKQAVEDENYAREAVDGRVSLKETLSGAVQETPTPTAPMPEKEMQEKEIPPYPDPGKEAPYRVTEHNAEHKFTMETRVETMKEDDVAADEDKTKKKDSESVLIFISPELDTPKDKKSDSTRASRRQLMPTSDEEKILLDYLNKKNCPITQGEYEKLLKEISSMLVSAPKNAVVIEITKIDNVGECHTLELCYHIKVRNELTKACFNYFEYKGK